MDALRMLSKGPGSTDYDVEVERLLSCPICLEVYSKPVVILPCQHNLCRKCASDVFQNRGTPMGSGGRFRCPTCRYEVMLDRHGVYGLQRNLLVENIIDMYQSESKKPFRKLELLMCEEHDDEKVNIFCITCQKPTCSLCKVFGQHQDCTVSPVEKVYKDHKTEISGAIAVLVAGNDRLQNIISSTEEQVQLTEENSKIAQTNMCASFDKLYSILEERKQIMLNHIKSDAHEKKESLQQILKQYGSQLERSSKLVEEALSLLEESNVPQFLSVSRDLINRVTTTARSIDVKKTYINTDMEVFNVDFSILEAELGSIQFSDAFGADYDEEKSKGIDTGEIISSTDSDTNPTISTCGSVRAKLLLPKEDDAAEIVASAEVTTEKSEDTADSDDGAPTGSQRRRVSNTSLDDLDSDVKAIAERYLTERQSRRHDSDNVNSSRRKSYSDEGNRARDQASRYKQPSATYPASTQMHAAISLENNSQSSTRSNSPVTLQERARLLRSSVQTAELPDSPTELQESSEALIARVPQRSRRSPRQIPRTYTTHRRRTWSHLLEKK